MMLMTVAIEAANKVAQKSSRLVNGHSAFSGGRIIRGYCWFKKFKQRDGDCVFLKFGNWLIAGNERIDPIENRFQ